MTDSTQRPSIVKAHQYMVWVAEGDYKYNISEEELAPSIINRVRKDVDDSGVSGVHEEIWLVPAGADWTSNPAHHAHELLGREMRLAE